MIYAVFGIPIMLWYLSNVGSLLAKIVRFFCSKICGCCICRETSTPSSSTASSHKVDPYFNGKPMEGGLHLGERQAQFTDKDINISGQQHRMSCCVIFALCIMVLLGYLCSGAYIVSQSEKWHFLDGFYFCFLTLTTISFGDSRSQNNGRLDKFKLSTEWFCSFYILFGMALTSMFFNILHEEISYKFKQWKHSPRNVRKEKESENSYSVHFMNFSSPKATATRNFTEETLVSNNEVHRGLANTESPKGDYVEDDIPQSDFIRHSMPNNRPMYNSNVHPVFPR